MLGPLSRRGLFLAYKDVRGGSEELWNIGGRGPVEELGTSGVSGQGCFDVSLGSTEPCLPLSNLTSARLCLCLKSPDRVHLFKRIYA